MSKYTQTIVDIERAQALQDTPSAAMLIVGAIIAVLAVLMLTTMFFIV